jgi:hypothetical protein
VADRHAPGRQAVAAGQLGAQLPAGRVGIALHAPPRGPGDRGDHRVVGQARPRRAGQVQSLDAVQSVALALQGTLVSLPALLLGGERLELAVVVEQPH